MKFSLIICTYMRPDPLLKLLQSVKEQSLYPNEILIIDGSTNREVENVLKENIFENVSYFFVFAENRGLTKQRNFGITKVSSENEIVCFLDDDTVLERCYFEELINTFVTQPEVSGVGGVAINENRWIKKSENKNFNHFHYYEFEGYIIKESLRNVVRNYLGLASNLAPGKMPNYSHGRTCGFPITGEIYEADLLIGMSMAFRKSVLARIKFSKFFEGYGLYEDADFSIRALQFGKNVINTKVQLKHFHDPSGRPNLYKYGKMVTRNGWYVWRIKNPNPKLLDCFKWNAITVLLILIRFSNIITEKNKKAVFSEAMGRKIGWLSLLFDKPKQQ